jgi:hypothetical protein
VKRYFFGTSKDRLGEESITLPKNKDLVSDSDLQFSGET